MADYGMQQTLTSRYGIKSYGVPGVDYCFVNGDPTDFRRENLQIHNIYHGVRKTVTKNGQHVYTVRIHIRGNYIVGRYATDVEAAIAYNKAIDILHSKESPVILPQLRGRHCSQPLCRDLFYARHCPRHSELSGYFSE